MQTKNKVALDLVNCDTVSAKTIMQKITSELNKYPMGFWHGNKLTLANSLGTHFLTTNSTKWNSVVEYDMWFADYFYAETVEKFIEMVKRY